MRILRILMVLGLIVIPCISPLSVKAQTLPDDDAASRAATAYITRSSLPQPTREAILTVLRQHPAEQRWSGKSGATLFAVAAKALPKSENQQRMVPALLGMTHMLAINELLGAKSLLDQYATIGLTDATTLRKAVIQASGKLDVDGQAVGAIHLTGIEDNFAVGYVVSDEQALTAHLMQSPAMEAVKNEYRDVMHQQARDLMARSNWSDALLLWNHLHQRKLVSQALYLDAAQCFIQLGQTDDATRVLDEAINAFMTTASVEFLERAGDLALGIKTAQGDLIAEKAYRLASDRLQNSISSVEQRPTQQQEQQ